MTGRKVGASCQICEVQICIGILTNRLYSRFKTLRNLFRRNRSRHRSMSERIKRLQSVCLYSFPIIWVKMAGVLVYIRGFSIDHQRMYDVCKLLKVQHFLEQTYRGHTLFKIISYLLLINCILLPGCTFEN